MSVATAGRGAFYQQLRRYYGWFTLAFIVFVLMLAALEQVNLSRTWIGNIFLFATIALYAGIGIMSRTADVSEYYVAGRRVPALFNGMATAADWMSAASFIGMAGTLYAKGFDGLSYIMGWTGGYCLVALLIAPYLRKFGQFTIPDFLGARYGGNVARFVGLTVAILCSFVYVVAQIYGVGLITTRLTGVDFGVGIFLGLAGILVCSFLGGMRAVTWTQVAQYIVLVVAYLIPVVWLSIKLTGFVLPPQFAYGQVMTELGTREKALIQDKKEMEVRAVFAQRAADARARIAALPKSWEDGKVAAQQKIDDLRDIHAPIGEIKAAERALADYPRSPDEATRTWAAEAAANAARAAPPSPHAEPYYSANPDPAKAEAERSHKRKNFLALTFVLMLGTAALPHILMRFYTTPTVDEARRSVFWSIACIFLLYFTAPALAVLVKYDLYTTVVGKAFADLPGWVAAWTKVDPRLMSIVDINHDGLVQLAEITLGQDIVVLATPEIAGLPYVITGLVAAGGLAAALSTADGLLLTITNALSHDLYYKMINPNAGTQLRVTVSKLLLVFVAIGAAVVANYMQTGILFMVAAAFSLASSGFFVPLVAGIFWKRANKFGAVASMIVGVSVAGYYMVTTEPWLRSVFGVTGPIESYTWFGIDPVSAGIFGAPAALITLVVVSLLTPAPARDVEAFVEYVRHPRIGFQESEAALQED
ncbi:MAG TPA: sodium:solute symporter family protein [Burkholderiaceae bacterium]|nr:sodium:solute symporter family protein [Burkholderiaceae bacterium]